MWRDELKNAAVPLLSVFLGGVISIAAVYVQARVDEEKTSLREKKEKLEVLLNLALQAESSLNKMPAVLMSSSKRDDVEIAHQLRQMRMLSEIYFPALMTSADAYAKKVVSTMDGLIACGKVTELGRAEKEKCLAAAVETVQTSRELNALFDDARLELKRLGH